MDTPDAQFPKHPLFSDDPAYPITGSSVFPGYRGLTKLEDLSTRLLSGMLAGALADRSLSAVENSKDKYVSLSISFAKELIEQMNQLDSGS